MSRSRDIAAGSTRVDYIYTATANQTTFTGSDSNSNTLSYTAGLVEVFLNGTRLSAADFTATNGTSVVLASGADVNDIINIVAYGVFSVADRIEQRTEFDYTATSGQTTFSGNDNDGQSLSYTVGKIDVYLNGSHLNVTDDYVASNGTSVVLQSGATTGDILHIVNHGTTSLIGNFVDGETLDVNGNEIILDADGDTSITADTDDQIDFKVGGTDRVILSPTKIQMKSSGNAELELQAGASDSDNSLKYLNSSGSRRGFISYDTDNDFMFIGTSNAERIRIDSSGNVGIGTGTPQCELHISGAPTPEIRLTDTTNSVEANFFANDTVGTIGSKSNHAFVFNTNNTERMRISSDGKVGIGTTSPDAALTVQRAGDSDITFKHTDGNTKAFSKFTIADTTFKQGTVGADSFAFFTNNTEAHRIDSFRQFLFGGITSELTGNGGCLQLKSRNGNEHCATFRNGTSDGGFGINFQSSNGTERGSIRWTNSATNFNTSSDYRLKENFNYTFDATTEVKKLKPCKFNFKDESETIEGFLAHEVSDVVPVAVSGTKDETKDLGTIKDADGNVIRENVVESSKEDGQTWAKTSTENVYQSIDQSKLVPLLVKTIQELEARITALENE